jgi:ABC-type transport system involved in multi-copper enzyme maturation permease subunit
MVRLVRAEFVKLFTTWLWLWLLIASVGLTVLYASLAIVFADNPSNPTPPLSSAAGQRTIFSVGQGAATLVAVLGAIGLSGEFRHHTVTPTFLATPTRGRVVVAKLLTYFVVGIGYALVCIAASIAVAVPWLATKGITVDPFANNIPRTFAGVIAAAAVYALIGVGVAALVRDQVASVTGLLVYLFIVEPLVIRVPSLHDAVRYLPGPATNALTQVAQSNQHYLQPWQGGLVLAGYGLLLAVTGTLLAVRRDIT